MSRRRRKEKKRKEKRLERVPEKLQRKRDRQERYRTRRMPGWVRTSLVLVVIAVIIVGAGIIWVNSLPPAPDPEPTPGQVDILQQDIFYLFINETGFVQIDYMRGRYAMGTFDGDQPLNVSILRTFEQPQVNFTVADSSVFYDYYGNAYNIPPTIETNSLEYQITNVFPNFLAGDSDIKIDGGAQMHGWWSLFWDYYLNSSQNNFLVSDTIDDMFTFTFTIRAENNTIPYNTPTIVHCNITFNTLPVEGNVYNYGESLIIFPKQVFNETTLLANITVHDVSRIGSIVNPDQTPTINNETHIGFEALPITTIMSQNQSWGYTFDLNVTTFTNTSFSLLDLTTLENAFFMQSGLTGPVLEQPMHFPKAQIDIITSWSERRKLNVTDFHFRFPAVWVDNSSITFKTTQHQPPQPSHSKPLFPSKEEQTNHITLWQRTPPNAEGKGTFFVIPWHQEPRRLLVMK